MLDIDVGVKVETLKSRLELKLGRFAYTVVFWFLFKWKYSLPLNETILILSKAILFEFNEVIEYVEVTAKLDASSNTNDPIAW